MLNRGYRYVETLGQKARGLTALQYLTRYFTHSSEEVWRSRFETGGLTLDDHPLLPETLLLPGQRLVWSRPPWEEPDVPTDYAVLHEDADLLVVSKPSGLPTMPAGGFLENTLLALVRKRDPAWTPLHRLGRGTSGLVVFARTPEALRTLLADWRDHRIEKHYRALASGRVPCPLTITAPIGPVAHPKLGTVFAASPNGKPARSDIWRVTPRGDDSWVDLQIATGRPHQIRIHLAVIGRPLVGDPLYLPGGLPRAEALPGDLGYRLHAARLVFTHPTTRQALVVEAAPPPLLQGPHLF